ncbi:hypothetical protein Pint_24529 [Pistacia integerrima]|uniref:Uncharacterized protein n=1 Tax=Pistacia integerrima TaxID=434235 RepID=A0ACC0YCG0_9ROSI|nr:hypothetical protein Pint_24529 [Pistacia integerrima]
MELVTPIKLYTITVNIFTIFNSLDQDAKKDLTPTKLRAKAAKFAKATVKAQMASFKRYGVWADWNNPYLTLDPEYEAAQVTGIAFLYCTYIGV